MPGPIVTALPEAPPPPGLIPCPACRSPHAADAAKCPRCGTPNRWLHPEIVRFLDALGRFKHLREFWHAEHAFALTGRARADSGAKSWVQAGVGLGGFGLMLLPTGVGVLAMLGAVMIPAGIVCLVVGFLQAGTAEHSFEVNFRETPPRWSSTDDAFWAGVRRFFGLGPPTRAGRERIRDRGRTRSRPAAGNSRLGWWVAGSVALTVVALVAGFLIPAVVRDQSPAPAAEVTAVELYDRWAADRGVYSGQAVVVRGEYRDSWKDVASDDGRYFLILEANPPGVKAESKDYLGHRSVTITLRAGEIRNLPPVGKMIYVRGEVSSGSDHPWVKNGVIVRD